MYSFTLDHIGIISKNFDKSFAYFKKLGYQMKSVPVEDVIQNNYILMLHNNSSQPDIELICPMNSKSTVYNCKMGFHHMCYRVLLDSENEIESFVKEFMNWHQGRIITDKISAPAFDNKYIQFACVSGGLIMEFLYEVKKGEKHERTGL